MEEEESAEGKDYDGPSLPAPKQKPPERNICVALLQLGLGLAQMTFASAGGILLVSEGMTRPTLLCLAVATGLVLLSRLLFSRP